MTKDHNIPDVRVEAWNDESVGNPIPGVDWLRMGHFLSTSTILCKWREGINSARNMERKPKPEQRSIKVTGAESRL